MACEQLAHGQRETLAIAMESLSATNGPVEFPGLRVGDNRAKKAGTRVPAFCLSTTEC